MVDQEAWKSVCKSFFQGGDQVAQEAVACFDRSQASVASSHIIISIDSGVSPEAQQVLASVGMTNPSGLSTSDLLACVETKNKARREVHVLLEKARRDRLSQLLIEHGMVTPGSASQSPSNDNPSAPLSSLMASEAMADALRRFVSTYTSDPGVRPFVRGLVELITQQHKTSTVVRWVLPTETFTERAFPTFMDDAVLLMCGFFRYIAPGTGGERWGVPAGDHGWDVEHSLSDRQLSGMMSTLRYHASSSMTESVGVSGRIVVTDLPRTNQNGDFDEPSGSICPACAIL
jgi:hypothetical protein